MIDSEDSRFEYKPSTRELFRLVGWDVPHPEKPQYFDNALLDLAWLENYQLHRVALFIGSFTFLGLDQKNDWRCYSDGTWPIDSASVTALRTALVEHPEGYAGHDLAYLLLRAGIEDKNVMDRLHPLLA